MNKSIGAIWKRSNEKGEFYSGTLEDENGNKIKIVIFKNGYKDKDTQPDYLIYKSKENQKELSADAQYEKEEREAIQNENNYVIDENDLPF